MYSKTLLIASAVMSLFRANASEAAAPDSLNRRLEEIVVNAQAPATRVEGSSLVTIVPGTQLEKTGSLLDLLARLPLVTINDQTITVTGKGSPEIYIDGRPLRDQAELHTLQSRNIGKVELLMAPGAQYDSSTQSVLLITTRRNFAKGLSLQNVANATIKRRFSANDYLSLSWHGKSMELFASGTYARNNSLIKGHTVNRLAYQGRPMTIGSSQHREFPTDNAAVKTGFNYTGGKSSAGAYYRYLHENADFLNTGTEWLDNNPPIRREISQKIQSATHMVSAYYDDLYCGRHHLHFDGTFRHGDSRTRSATEYPDGESTAVKSTQHKQSSLFAAELYMETPVANGKLTAGTQGAYTTTSLDYDMLNADVAEYVPSSLADTRNISIAAYASWSRTWGQWNVRAGLRYEYSDYTFRLNGVSDRDVSRRDHLLTPDISAGYNFSDRSSLTLSYKMTTLRPPYSQLTSGITYTGTHELESGNPALRDERMHSVQMLAQWNDFMLQTQYTRSLDTYAFVKRLYPAPTVQLLLQPVNADVSTLSCFLIWNRTIKSWSPSIMAGASKPWLTLGSTDYNKPMYFYSVQNALTLPCGFMLTADISGQSGGDMHTNRFGSSWFTCDASVSKTFLDKSLTVKLQATDIFGTQHNDWSMHTCNVTMLKYQRYDNRGVSLTVTYHFQPRRSHYKGSTAAETEIKRL